MIRAYIDGHIEMMSTINGNLISPIKESVALISKCIKNKNRIYFIGNGGSAADCQHLAAEFAGKYRSSNALPAMALTTDTSVLTSIANDYSFDHIFDLQIEAFVKPNDVVLAISTSGNSRNVVNGILRAKQLNAKTICLTGADGGLLAPLCDVSIQVPSNQTNYIQEAHIMIGHIIYENVCRGNGHDK